MHDKAFNIAKHPNFEEYQISLLIKNFWWWYQKWEYVIQELSEELHKSIIRKFEKRKVHSPVVQNIWGANFADM